MVKKFDEHLIERDLDFLIARVDNGTFKPDYVLGEVLEGFYDIVKKRAIKSKEIKLAHRKVRGLMMHIQARTDEESKRVYAVYKKVYDGLCRELMFVPKLVTVGNSKSGSNKPKNGDAQNGKLLNGNYVTLIASIQKGEIDPLDFLAQGLDELEAIASRSTFSDREFSDARSTYLNVFDFLKKSGEYKFFDDYQEAYEKLLKRVPVRSADDMQGNGDARKSSVELGEQLCKM